MSHTVYRNVAAVAAGVVLLGVGVLRAEGPADPKPATSPEEAVWLYHEAVRAGDLEGGLAYVSRSVRGAWRATVTMVRATQGFEAALDRQFDKDPEHRRMFDPAEEMRAVKRIDIRGRQELKTEIRLTLWKVRPGPDDKDRITEEVVNVVQEESGWVLQLHLPFTAAKTTKAVRQGPDGRPVEVTVLEQAIKPTPAQEAKVREVLARGTAIIQGITAEVLAGKYASRHEAINAFRARLAPRAEVRTESTAPR
ncbi:MAG: hypothetical protein HYS12_04065 [Planctomycetes bacterium]|nr:hypothetical protein [Planctomycetota bacterium]